MERPEALPAPGKNVLPVSLPLQFGVLFLQLSFVTPRKNEPKGSNSSLVALFCIFLVAIIATVAYLKISKNPAILRRIRRWTRFVQFC